MSNTSNLLDDSSFDVPANPSGNSYSFLSSLNLDIDVTRRLTSHLDHLVSGNNDVYLTPIAKDNDPSVVLESWSKIFESRLEQMNSPLLQLEQANRDKFGPRSIAKPWRDRVSDIELYYSNKETPIPFDLLSGAKYPIRGKLRPLSVDKSLQLLKNQTNSGLPYYTQKGKVKLRTQKRLESLLLRRDPCILFTRTQEGGKTRNVWGYPCADTLEEMRFYKPVLSLHRKLQWRSALSGPDEVSKFVTLLLLRARDNGHAILSSDISAFDANVSLPLIRASFGYLKQLFQSDFHYGLDRICDRFSSIDLLTPDGIATGIHGVPSGSTFTNEVDSIVQYLIVKSLGIIDECIQIQGDDMLLCLSESEVPKVLQRYKECKLPINEDKSVLARDYCIYLQNLFHIDYMKNGVVGGIYPTYRALNRILYQERWSKFEDFNIEGIDYYSIRTISILENCKHHPLFTALVEFVWKLDKYSLRYSRDGVNKYNIMLNESSGTGGFLNNQYGDDIRGIDNFETVKLIRKLRK